MTYSSQNRLIISTVGASALLNINKNNTLVHQDEFNQLNKLLNKEDRGSAAVGFLLDLMLKYYGDNERNRLLPAEITSLRLLNLEPDQDRLAFLIGTPSYSKIPDWGTVCGKALVKYFTELGFEVEEIKIYDFVYIDENTFIEPLRLIGDLEAFLKKERRNNPHLPITLNVTGGYKVGAIQGVIVGLYYSCEVCYQYEKSRALVRLPAFSPDILELEPDITSEKFKALSPEYKDWYQPTQKGYTTTALSEILYKITELRPKEETIIPPATGSPLAIQFLAASPVTEVRLAVERELRDIQLELSRFPQLQLHFMGAVRPRDFTREILDKSSYVLHFSGHGMQTGEICLEDDIGKTKLVQPEALAELFKIVKNRVTCVLLNACYSQVQAEAIARHIKYVIGMSDRISATAAKAFAIGFYQNLARAYSIEEAFAVGRTLLMMESFDERDRPRLYKDGQLFIAEGEI